MQERRIFPLYLKENLVPASAVVPVIGTTTFNVAYFPIGGGNLKIYYNPANASHNPYITLSDPFPEGRIPYATLTDYRIDYEPLAGTRFNYFASPGTLSFSTENKGPFVYGLLPVYSGSSGVAGGSMFGNDIYSTSLAFQGYVKIKFSHPMKFDSLTGTCDHDILVDTEE